MGHAMPAAVVEPLAAAILSRTAARRAALTPPRLTGRHRPVGLPRWAPDE